MWQREANQLWLTHLEGAWASVKNRGRERQRVSRRWNRVSTVALLPEGPRNLIAGVGIQH
uniref:Uncharacterized protein n=1 Tax=Arundo donax TaxID=35708 RepID=A0A0A9BJQ4_ARUDO